MKAAEGYTIEETLALLKKSQPIEERHFQSLSFCMKSEKMEAAKEKLEGFVSEFIRTFEADEGTGDEVFQINLQLFKQTDRK